VSFTSPLFYLPLAVAAIAFYLIPGRFRAVYLLALSYAFYGFSSRLYLLLLIIATASSYAIGLGIANGKSDETKSRLMLLGVAAIVAVIVAFKAAGAATGFLLPLGLSYYSFKLISYLIEVYWDEESVERDPVIFFLYPAFFPQIVSGPIQRPGPFFHQMREVMHRAASDPQIEAGFRYIIGGLMLKLLISDRLAVFIDTVDRAHADFNYTTMLATVVCYTLRLYTDFAGYTNIALGIGKLFGIEGPPNFNAPFAATNIQAMWRRWHMSLTSWLTDYLFTPLSMSLRNLGRIGIAIAITVNMVTIGIWHGFTLNYLVFGLLHALFLSVTVLVLGYRARRRPPGATSARLGSVKQFADRFSGVLGAVLTFALMSFSQIFFHSPTWSQAISILRQIFGLTSSGSLGWSDLGLGFRVSVWICMAVSLFVGLGYPGFNQIFKRLDAVTPRWVQYGVGIFLLTVLVAGGSGRFVYGQF
jgi:alginate O-acetyltransferase complex protein AlgI